MPIILERKKQVRNQRSSYKALFQVRIIGRSIIKSGEIACIITKRKSTPPTCIQRHQSKDGKSRTVCNDLPSQPLAPKTNRTRSYVSNPNSEKHDPIYAAILTIDVNQNGLTSKNEKGVRQRSQNKT